VSDSRILDAGFRVVSLTDAQLVERCLRGDADAERELFRAHMDRMFRLAFRFCGDADRATDCTQEAFIRAFDRLGQFRGESSLATWLNAIVVSIAINDARRASTISRRHVELTDALPSTRRADAPHDLKQRLYAAIDALSPKLRAVFVMHEVEGYTHEEIAEILGVPVGTSKGRLSDARARLRSVLAVFAGDQTA
jgi:RNA polymerase sigma-70 factor (ECF subfamily)